MKIFLPTAQTICWLAGCNIVLCWSEGRNEKGKSASAEFWFIRELETGELAPHSVLSHHQPGPSLPPSLVSWWKGSQLWGKLSHRIIFHPVSGHFQQILFCNWSSHKQVIWRRRQSKFRWSRYLLSSLSLLSHAPSWGPKSESVFLR